MHIYYSNQPFCIIMYRLIDYRHNNLFQHMVEQAFLIFYSARSTTKLLCFQLIQFIQDVKFKERSFLKDFFDLLLRAIHNSGLNFLPGNMEIGAC